MTEPRRLKSAKPKSAKAKREKKTEAQPEKSSGKIKHLLKKEVNIPLPDSRLGNILSKKGRIFPGFMANAWNELKQVIWPDRRETVKLTFAVLAFTLGLGMAIAGVDFVLEKIFKEVILP